MEKTTADPICEQGIVSKIYKDSLNSTIRKYVNDLEQKHH